MKKIIYSLVMVLGLTASATASELYAANEFSVTLGSGYVVNAPTTTTTQNGGPPCCGGSEQSSTVKNQYAEENDYSVNVGVQYFLTKHFGVEAIVPVYQTHGASVSEVQAGFLARLPLSQNTAVLKNIAPYLGVGGVYSWEREQWAYIGKVGADYRLAKNWSLFAEGQYRNADFDLSEGATTVVGGLRFVF